MVGEMPKYPVPCGLCKHGPVVADEALSNVCWTCRSHLRWPLYVINPNVVGMCVVEQKEEV